MLTKPDIEKIRNLLYESNLIAREFKKNGLEVSYKADKSPVTNADIEISRYLGNGLKTLYPDIKVVCEEGCGTDTSGEYFWLIDPIDGTRGYIKGYNIYSINIGLVHKDQAQYGFISVPEYDRIYYTDEKKNLILEEAGSVIQIPEVSHQYKAVLSGDPSERSNAHEIMRLHNIVDYEYIPSSVKFCLIATGEADIYPRYGRTMEWDTAAGSALVKASGGTITDLDGYELLYNKYELVNKGFIAYSKRLFDKGV